MGAERISAPITVGEYERIPDPPGGRYELHHGELVFVTYPVRRRGDLQDRIRQILRILLGGADFVVRTEYPYRPLPENEVWGADVACVRGERHRGTAKWLGGSPELVIEVKSPSNTKTELQDKAMTTLAGEGALEFWVVDADAATVTVYSRTGMTVYGADASVPVPLAGKTLGVAEVLAAGS